MRLLERLAAWHAARKENGEAVAAAAAEMRRADDERPAPLSETVENEAGTFPQP